MSMLQIEKFLTPHPVHTETDGKPLLDILYVFYDDYYSVYRLRDKYPGTRLCGLAWLPGWTWHINIKGEPNIRPSAITPNTRMDGPVVSPATTFGSAAGIGTFGYAVKITAAIEKQLNEKLAATHIAITTDIRLISLPHSHLPPRPPIITKALVYFDARNTADACVDLLANKLEKARWMQGLGNLKTAGVPIWYLLNVQRQLSGERTHVEPLAVSMYDIIRPIPISKGPNAQQFLPRQCRSAEGSAKQISCPPSSLMPQRFPSRPQVGQGTKTTPQSSTNPRLLLNSQQLAKEHRSISRQNDAQSTIVRPQSSPDLGLGSAHPRSFGPPRPRLCSTLAKTSNGLNTQHAQRNTKRKSDVDQYTESAKRRKDTGSEKNN